MRVYPGGVLLSGKIHSYVFSSRGNNKWDNAPVSKSLPFNILQPAAGGEEFESRFDQSQLLDAHFEIRLAQCVLGFVLVTSYA